VDRAGGGPPLISASSIIAAMSDNRPGRFYSVDELAALLRVQDKVALHRQLRAMVADPDLPSGFKLRLGSSDDFYRPVSFAALSSPGGPWQT